MAELALTDMSSRLGTREVRELLLQLEYPDEIRESKTDQIIAEYREHPERPILGGAAQGKLVGLIGLALQPGASAIIRHIVVRRDHRRSGIGKALIDAVCSKYFLGEISAETDRDAVDFYRRCGFHIESLGEKYPGTERFWCTLRACEGIQEA